MLCLVSGGAGFLGSHLVNRLVEDGETVVIVDDFSTGHVRNIEFAISSGRATLVYGDVAQSASALRDLIRHAAKGPLERIYHLASPASPVAYGEHPWETLAVNAIGTMSLIDLAVTDGARFLYASTSEIYGDPLVHPQPESYFGNVDTIGPRSCYDEGKRFGEAAVAAGVRARGLDGRIVRFFNCYGPGMSEADGRLVPELFAAAYGNRPFPIHGHGRQTRSMTFVGDAIDLVQRVMSRSQDTLQPVNVGNDDERSVFDIASVVAKVAGVPFDVTYEPAREADPQQRRPDLTRARTFGWEPSTSLEDGLRKTYEWYARERLSFA